MNTIQTNTNTQETPCDSVSSVVPDRTQKDLNNLAQAASAHRCLHAHTNGRRCGSPAVAGSPYCFFHRKIRHPQPKRIVLPVIEDNEQVQIFISHVLNDFQRGRLTRKDACTYLFGLQMAMTNLKRIADKKEKEKEGSSGAYSAGYSTPSGVRDAHTNDAALAAGAAQDSNPAPVEAPDFSRVNSSSSQEPSTLPRADAEQSEASGETITTALSIEMAARGYAAEAAIVSQEERGELTDSMREFLADAHQRDGENWGRMTESIGPRRYTEQEEEEFNKYSVRIREGNGAEDTLGEPEYQDAELQE